MFKKQIVWLFLCLSLPLIFTTIYLSISRDTLPHWSGVSYLTLLPLLAVFLSEKNIAIKKLLIGIIVLFSLKVMAVFVINYGLFLPAPTSEEKEKLSKNDALMDMYGWEQTAKKIMLILEEKKLKNLPIISNKWYPAAHIDYYLARPNKMDVYGVGSLTNIHKYYWINKTKPALPNAVLYITDSRNFANPKVVYGTKYSSVEKIAAVPIKRNGIVVKYVFLFKLQN